MSGYSQTTQQPGLHIYKPYYSPLLAIMPPFIAKAQSNLPKIEENTQSSANCNQILTATPRRHLFIKQTTTFKPAHLHLEAVVPASDFTSRTRLQQN